MSAAFAAVIAASRTFDMSGASASTFAFGTVATQGWSPRFT